MNYVYGEEVIIVNFIGDFMILATALLARNKRFSFIRCAGGAAIGVAYAFAAILWNNILVNLPLKALISLAMAAVLSKPCTLKNVLLNAVLIIFTSFVAAGCILFLSFMCTSALYTEGGYIFSSNYMLLFFGMLAGCLSVKQIYGILNKYLRFDRLIYPCTVIHNDKIKDVNLLADSGNLLRTLTGKNIVVFDYDIFNYLTGISKTSFGSYEEYEQYFQEFNEFNQMKIGVVQAKTIHSAQYLLVVKMDEIHFKSGPILNGVYTASGDIKEAEGKFNGIFNPILLRRRFDYELEKTT